MRLATLTALLCALPAAAAAQPVEHWIVSTDMWGTAAYSTLDIERHDNRLGGSLDGDPVVGSIEGDRIRLSATDSRGATYAYSGTLAGGTMRGEADLPDSNHTGVRITHPFSARRLPDRPVGGPRTWTFEPTTYSNLFSADRTPVLTIWPGDSVRTRTIDSGGVDEHDKTVALFGNPQTGPFFIAGAEPGDTLAVHIVRLTPNRDWADSLDTIVARALGSSLIPKATDLGKPVRWTLDRKAGVARPDGASGALSSYAVPLRPMLGGLAVAPGFGWAAMSTGDTGRTGGNMDFPEIAEGATVFLPVQQPGALLYLGDAHALQGDGETSQYALETSMDVEFRVELIKHRAIPMPRVETARQIAVLGQAGSLDEALKAASTGMIGWLQQDYGFTLSQAAQVLGSAVRYSVPNLAGRSVGVAAHIDKALLPPPRDK